MSLIIDTSFDVYSDTPKGRDPDSHSLTLRRYHRILWSKPLPDGRALSLSDKHPRTYLYHKSELGEFALSSDSIGHTYRNIKVMASIVNEEPEEELDRFFSICSTVGAYLVFPSRKVGQNPTINGARGLHWKIKDRFDLTLECIRRHYLNRNSPLSEALARYSEFFNLFGSFKGYTDHFLLQDLISETDASINFFLPFQNFDGSPLPANIEEYRMYRDRLATFVIARNRRIAAQTPECI